MKTSHKLSLAGALVAGLVTVTVVTHTPSVEPPAPVVQDMSAVSAAAALAEPTTFNFHEVVLPAGDVGSINIAWFKNGVTSQDPNTWLSAGKDGIRFTGQGIDVTHIRSTGYDGLTIAIKRHNGVVEIRNATIHAGYDRGVTAGEQNLPGKDAQGNTLPPGTQTVQPKFQLRLVNCKVVVDPPFEYFQRQGKFSVSNGGTDYRVGDQVTALGGQATSPATFRVTEIIQKPIETEADRGLGAIKAAEVISRGVYTTGPPYEPLQTTTTGKGKGAQLTLGTRPKWGVFSYNADLFVSRCIFETSQGVEHSLYSHGFAKRGAYFEFCQFNGSGAEGAKFRADATETGWAGPDTWIVFKSCTFRNWYQPWSWRGGAGVVIQGAASNVYAYRCVFYGGGPIGTLGVNDRSKAFMVSSEGLSYAQGTGEVDGNGFGNGSVHIVECAFVAGPGTAPAWRNSMVYCARNGGTQLSARSFSLLRSGLWGDGMTVQFSDIPSGKLVIDDCNTPTLKSYATNQLQMDTRFEVVFPMATRRVPLSEFNGVVR